MAGGSWSPDTEGEPLGGRRNPAYRITLRIWTAVVIGFDLFLFVALHGWDNSSSFVSGLDAFLAMTIVFLPLIWALGYGLISTLFTFLD